MRPKGWRPIRRGVDGADRVEERVVFVGVAVRPAIDGDGLDVAGGIESSGGEDAAELVADVALEGFEGGEE